MNQLLAQAKAATLEKADPRLRPVIEQIVKAGETLMYSPQTSHMFKTAMAQTTPDLIGASFAGMAILLLQQAKKDLPMEALIPAASILLTEGLQFLEDSGRVKIDANFLATATQAMGQKLLELLKATPEKLQGMVDKSKGVPPAQAAEPAAAQPGPSPAQAAPPAGIVGRAMQGAA